MKPIHITIKTIWQCFLVCLEVFGLTYLFVWLSSNIRPYIDLFDFMERFILFLALYEIFVYVTLTFINDARQDAFLALKSSYELGLLYSETGIDQLKTILNQIIDKQLEKGTFNHTDICQEYDQLREFINKKDMLSIRLKLVFISQNYESCSLKWKFSFLLRLFK